VQGIWPYVTNLQVGQTGYLYIIDQNGNLVAVPNEYRDSPVPNLNVSAPPENAYVGLNGQRVIGRVAAIANTPWWVVIEIPSQEANASLRALVAVLAAILMFGMSAAILVARLFSQWLLAPISQLQESAERISQGDLAHRVHLNRSDELGFLAEAINQMVATLESTITELRELSLRLISAQETERQRIARQIHDELGQTLTALKLNLWMSQRHNPTDDTLAAASKLATEVQETARSLSHELRPAMLDDLGLQPTLHWLIDRLEQRANLAISLEAELNENQLSAQMKITLYRLVAEALTNITKHAQASVVEILMYHRQNTLTLIIVDDGVGFDTKILQSTQSLGVDGMRERVNLLQGNFSIESKLNEGTKIVIELPCVNSS
jgi:signal transduction histidine kinase